MGFHPRDPDIDEAGLKAATASIHDDIGQALSKGGLWAEFDEMAYNAIVAYLKVAANENDPTKAGP